MINNTFDFNFSEKTDITILFSLKANVPFFKHIEDDEDEALKVFHDALSEIKNNLESGDLSGVAQGSLVVKQENGEVADLDVELIWRDSEKSGENHKFSKEISYNKNIEVDVNYTIKNEDIEDSEEEDIEIPDYLKDQIRLKVEEDGNLKGVEYFEDENEIEYEVSWEANLY